MSNYLAIATVTATLSQLLQEAAGEAVPGASTTTGRPESVENGAPGPGINVYLYQVVPNAAWRNADLPTRRADGTVAQRPQAALDLHYLLTFYGNETDLEPQRLLGSAASTLHARPVLTRDRIRATIQVAADDHYLKDSDLADQVETVKFSPLPLNLEELSKLWSVFFQTPYALSVAYRASAVLIEGDGTPKPALPLRAPRLYGGTFHRPVVERVASQAGRGQPIVVGGTLLIQGHRLRGEVTRVRIGEAEMTPPEENVSDARIALRLPGSLRAGVLGVQVVHLSSMGEPPSLRHSAESNVVPCVLRPTIVAASVSGVQGSGSEPRSADVTVQVTPPVGEGQRAALLLNELSDDAPTAYTFASPPCKANAETITFHVSGVKAAEYLVRVQVDGAESPLVVDTNPDSLTFNRYIKPAVGIGISRVNLLQAAIDLSITRGCVNGTVTIRDENDDPVADATVSATWNLPDGGTAERSGDTDRNGVVRFRVNREPGSYVLTITDVAKADYTFDPDNSILSESITIG